MNPHPRWTQTHIGDLRAGLLQGEHMDAIALALDRSREDVASMVRRLGLRSVVPS